MFEFEQKRVFECERNFATGELVSYHEYRVSQKSSLRVFKYPIEFINVVFIRAIGFELTTLYLLL